MKVDLCIKNIDAIYRANTNEWNRNYFAPRKKEGIVFVKDGVNRYNFLSEQVFAKKNDIVILPGDVPYSGVSCSSGKFEGIVIDFECCNGTSLAQIGLPYVISVSDCKYYEMLFKEIETAWGNKYADSNLHVKSLLYKLIYKLYREINEISNEKIPAILEYINANIENKNLSVASLCRDFYLSESTLMRGVKKLTGYTPNVYINQRRLEKAREYILIGGKSVKEISILCGFSSPYYLSNLFKKKYGYSPRKYKEVLNKDNGGNRFN